MPEFRERAGDIVRTVQRLAALQGNVDEAEVLAVAEPRLIETGHDNWDGGRDFFTLTLEIPIERYAAIEPRRTEIEKWIGKRTTDLLRTETGFDITEVVISPKMDSREPAADDEAAVEYFAAPENPPSFWTPGHFRLFISHPSQVRALAHNVKSSLGSYRVAAFVAHDDIEPTHEWQAEIESALRTMDALVALITPDFVSSRWCDQEVGMAIGRGKLVIPIRMGADPHGFLGKYQGLNGAGEHHSILAKSTTSILIKHSQSAARMTDALVDGLLNASSWDSAKRLTSALESAPRLTMLQSTRLLASIDKNREVADAFGVPERIRSLVGRLGQRDAS